MHLGKRSPVKYAVPVSVWLPILIAALSAAAIIAFIYIRMKKWQTGKTSVPADKPRNLPNGLLSLYGQQSTTFQPSAPATKQADQDIVYPGPFKLHSNGSGPQYKSQTSISVPPLSTNDIAGSNLDLSDANRKV